MKKKLPLLFFAVTYIVTLTGLLFFLPKNQDPRTKASSDAVLSLSPKSSLSSPITRNINDPVPLDIILHPGTSYVSIVKLHIIYDSRVLKTPDKYVFVPNKSALSSITDGPLIENGTIIVTLSVGTNPQNALKSRMKLGTINLIAKEPTDIPAIVKFGEETEAFSVAPHDHAYENILATASPAYVVITEESAPLPTKLKPTKPKVSSPPFPTSVPNISANPTPTPHPDSTVLHVNTYLHGIGISGDNTNPNGNFSNKEPQRFSRKIVLTFINNANNLLGTREGLIIYDKNKGLFTGAIDLGVNTISTGDYKIKLKTEGYLQKMVPGIQRIVTKSKTNTLPSVHLTTGDTNHDNALSILDFNSIMSCYTDIAEQKTCNDKQKQLTDINDDSKINHVDYNLFIREISIPKGD